MNHSGDITPAIRSVQILVYNRMCYQHMVGVYRMFDGILNLMIGIKFSFSLIFKLFMHVTMIDITAQYISDPQHIF